MKKILENIVNAGKKILVGGALLAALSGCFSVKKQITDNVSLRTGIDTCATTHHLSSDKTYFSPAPSTGETGDVKNTSYPFSIGFDLRNSTHFENLDLNIGLKADYVLFENFANEMTGYLAGPWDVDYAAGINPMKRFGAYVGIGREFDNWAMDFSVGFPYTSFLWEKSYWEQVRDKTTTLERDWAKSHGISIGMGFEYELDNDLWLRFGLEQEFYNDVGIAGEKTDIENLRLNAILSWKFQ